MAQNFDGENIDEFDEFPAIRQYFPYQIFHLVSYLYEMNEYIGIRQFFTRQTFPNPDLSKISTIKNLHHTAPLQSNALIKFYKSHAHIPQQ